MPPPHIALFSELRLFADKEGSVGIRNEKTNAATYSYASVLQNMFITGIGSTGALVEPMGINRTLFCVSILFMSLKIGILSVRHDIIIPLSWMCVL